RALEYSHQDATTIQVYDPKTLRLVKEFDANHNGTIDPGERTEGFSTTLSHGGRDQSDPNPFHIHGSDPNPFASAIPDLVLLHSMSDDQRRVLLGSMLSDQASYDKWWDATNGTTQTAYLDPALMFNQLKVDTQSTHSLTLSRDSAQNIQDNLVTYKYSRHPVPRSTPLDSPDRTNAANNGPLF